MRDQRRIDFKITRGADFELALPLFVDQAAGRRVPIKATILGGEGEPPSPSAVVVKGDLESVFLPGDEVLIARNGPVSDGIYTVTESEHDEGLTTIELLEALPAGATNFGWIMRTENRPIDLTGDQWFAKTAGQIDMTVGTEDEAEGKIWLRLTREQTAAHPVGRFVWDMLRIRGNPERHSFPFQGRVVVVDPDRAGDS